MRFSLFSIFPYPDVTIPQRDIFENTFELFTLADQAGFDCLWVAEHHFSNVGLCSAPLTLVHEAAHRTRRVRVGVAVLVLPVHEPLRLAEEVATVDLLIGGRLNVGIGRGYQRHEFERYRVPLEEGRERFLEVHAILRQAWTGEPFSFQGRYFQIPETTVLPRPLQRPHPPVWVAAASPETVNFAAEHGYSLFTTAGLNPISAIERGRDLYHAALARHSRSPDGLELARRRTIFVTENPREADEALEQAYYQYRLTRRFATNTVQVVDGVARATPFDDEPSREEAREQLIWGSPEQCIRQIERLCEIGVTYTNLMFQVGRLTHPQVLRSFTLFAERVLPHVGARPAPAAIG